MNGPSYINDGSLSGMECDRLYRRYSLETVNSHYVLNESVRSKMIERFVRTRIFCMVAKVVLVFFHSVVLLS